MTKLKPIPIFVNNVPLKEYKLGQARSKAKQAERQAKIDGLDFNHNEEPKNHKDFNAYLIKTYT